MDLDLDLDFGLDSCEDDFSIEEFDIDFEFDAPRFFDFSNPQQVDSETEESQLWFELESSGNYPPSPFSFKLSWRSDSKPVDISSSLIPTSEIDNGYIYYNQTVKEAPKTKTTRFLSNYSTLSRPTVSFLARQNKPLDIYSVQLLRRCQRSLGNFDDKISSLLFSMVQNQDTKRQKLETGFLRKVSRLDQTPFVHKVPRKVAHVSSNNFKCKVTVPREPNLKTAERAARHRYKVKSAPEQISKWSSTASKRQVQENCSTYLPKMKTTSPQDFQAFHLRTSLKARERFSTAKNAPTDDVALAPSQASKSVHPIKARKVKESCISKTKFQVNESMIFPQDTKLIQGI